MGKNEQHTTENYQAKGYLDDQQYRALLYAAQKQDKTAQAKLYGIMIKQAMAIQHRYFPGLDGQGLDRDGAVEDAVTLLFEKLISPKFDLTRITEPPPRYIASALHRKMLDLLDTNRSPSVYKSKLIPFSRVAKSELIDSRHVSKDASRDIPEELERQDREGNRGLTQQEHTFLARAMGGLSPQHKDVVEATVFNGQTYEQCAKTLDIKVGTVRSRKNRAIEELRESFDRQETSDKRSLRDR